MITIKISLHSKARGRGFWKLNSSFLADIEYVNHIKAVINQTRNEYEKDVLLIQTYCGKCLK